MRSFSKDQLVILLVLGLMIATVNLLRLLDPSYSGLKSYHCSPKPQHQQQWIVEVTGAVKKPGIYTFHNPPTIHQAIRTARGTTKSALAPFGAWPEQLETGTLLEVKALEPQTTRIIFSRISVSKRLSLGIPIEVNQAQEKDLALIPGVGQALARRIVEFRESQGAFRKWNDLIKVKGVGPTNIQRFRNYLKFKHARIPQE